jgi:nucleobase:cation symporter-1, NCS1 family
MTLDPQSTEARGGAASHPDAIDEAAARDAAAAASGAAVHGVEQHGIDLIPAEHRWGRPRDLLWLWMGVTLNIEFLVFGGLLPAVGLSFWQSVLAIVIGNLAWFLTGATSLQGPRTGTAMFMITRAPFGTRGARLVALFNWLSLVTYETIGLVLIVLGALALLGEFGVVSSTALKIALIPLAASLESCGSWCRRSSCCTCC